MRDVKVAAVFLVLLILLSGCQNGDKPGKTKKKPEGPFPGNTGWERGIWCLAPPQGPF